MIRVLFVCLGNICRSPTAEGVLRHLLAIEAPQLDVEIDSAGTGSYHLGEPPDLRSQRAAERRGIDLSALRARQVTLADFAHFDLILAMDRQNLRALEAMRPRSSTAQLRLYLEYANRPSSAGAPRIAGEARETTAGDPRDLEIPDPYTGLAEDFEHVLDLVTAAARGLIASLANLDRELS